MKKFDLEAALKGAPVITRGNHPARIICTDAKGNLPIIALISNNGVENPVKYTLDGRYYTKGHLVMTYTWMLLRRKGISIFGSMKMAKNGQKVYSQLETKLKKIRR